MISCLECSVPFPQPDERYFDLFPDDSADPLTERWRERQTEMEGWYKSLIAAPEHASRCFTSDYELFPSGIFEGSGDVLDLGCGNGVLRNYLPPGTRYVGLDPSVTWLDSHWESLSGRFPCLAKLFPFVRGVGEHLPFVPGVFDRVFAFWSLNHARRPERVIHEVWRVLRPGGRLFLVLEDMQPRWRDVPDRVRFALSNTYWTKVMTRNLLHLLVAGTWPLQGDHIRISDRDISGWSRGAFRIEDRAWCGNYLTYELVRNSAQSFQPTS